MLVRALAVWFVLLILASANGALREGVIVPAAGNVAGRAISTLLLSGIILVLTWLTIKWIAPVSATEAWAIGGAWVALTLAFEFLGGHYLFGQSWARLVEDYNLAAGRIWILVLITTAVSPWLMGRARGLRF
jgi:hypothetical protein